MLNTQRPMQISEMSLQLEEIQDAIASYDKAI